MGWFKRLFGGNAPAAPAPSGPGVVDLVPGKLSARITAHDFAAGPSALPCWTYVTQGFWALGQKEFVFTLVRGRGDDPARPPPDPLLFFAQIFALAEQKQFVDAGGYTCFHPRAGGFLGLSGLIGFAYTPPEVLPGIDMPPSDQCLTAIFLVPGEAELVQAGFGYRVLARLGRANRYYPHPPWSVPRRVPVLTRDELSTSLLGKMPVAYLSGAFARMFIRTSQVPAAGQSATGPLGDRLLLRVRRDRLPRLRELLGQIATGPEGAFALTFDADPEANVRLAWHPGDPAPSTITPATGDASCLTGGFLALVFGPTIEDGGRVVEDGFALTFGPDTWSRVRDALLNGEPLALPPGEPGAVALSIEWIDGPPDPAARATRPAPTSSAFRVHSMMFYQPDEVLRARLPSVEALVDFVKRAEALAAEFWNARPAGNPVPVLVVVAVKSGGRVRVWADVPEGSGLAPAARDFAGQLERLSPPVVQHGPVAVAMHAGLWGGVGGWAFIPEEWQSAAAGESLIVPDGVLERIWPD